MSGSNEPKLGSGIPMVGSTLLQCQVPMNPSWVLGFPWWEGFIMVSGFYQPRLGSLYFPNMGIDFQVWVPPDFTILGSVPL